MNTKNNDDEKQEEKISPKEKASFFSIITFWWMNELIIKGWKGVITIKDVYPLAKSFKARVLSLHFENYWSSPAEQIEEECKKATVLRDGNDTDVIISVKPVNKDKEKQKILKGLRKKFGAQFLQGSFFKLLHDLFLLSTPLILKAIINHVQADRTGDFIKQGVYLSLLLYFVSNFQSFLANAYFYKMYALATKIRATLMSIIYRKSIFLSNSARHGTTVGEIVNLMQVDTQKFLDVMPFINLMWSSPFQIIVATILLYHELGYSVFFGISVIILMFPLNAFVARFVKRLQIEQMKYKDERIKFLNEVLSGVKILKFYAWEDSILKKIDEMRAREIHKLKQIKYLGILTNFLWLAAPTLVGIITFAVYIIFQKGTLTAEKAFVSLTLLNILRFPLTLLPPTIMSIILLSASLTRIDRFLSTAPLRSYVERKAMGDAVIFDLATFKWNVKENDEEDEKTKKSASKKSKDANENQTDSDATQPAEDEETQRLLVRDEPNLRDIDFRIAEGSLVAIVGTIGSGKSSLLSALLGDMELISGNVSVNNKVKIAYVSQQAWIQNLTLKENIVFHSHYCRERYDQIIHACALDKDAEILPNGHDTEIGEKGINLSGGQKQRINLARACYSDANLFLLDDPLSAVDSNVAKHIFDHVISTEKGLLRHATRILVTNKLEILPKMDQIVVLKDGKISECGDYNQLMKREGEFSQLIRHFAILSENEEVQLSPTKSAEDLKNCSSLTREGSQEQEEEKEKVKLIEDEKVETGGVSFNIYLKYIRMLTYLWSVAAVVCLFFGSAMISGASIWLAAWTNEVRNTTKSERDDIENLKTYSYFGFAQVLFVIIGTYALVRGALLASQGIHQSLLFGVLRTPMSFFETTPVGRILNRFAKDIDAVDNNIPQTFQGWLTCFLGVFFTFLVIIYNTPTFIFVILIVGIFYYVIQMLYIAANRQLKRLEATTRSPIYSHFSETLSGVSTIRAFNLADKFISDSDKKIDQNSQCLFYSFIANRWLSIRLESCGNIFTLFATLLAVLASEELGPGNVGLSITYALSVTQILNYFIRMSSDLEMSIVSVERIVEYLKSDSEADWYMSDMKPLNTWPENGAIEFVDYSTRYRQDLDPILKNLTFTIKKGEKIGIVGRTGAGKSSITLALFRIIEPTTGKILIDDIDITKLALHDLRSRLAIIPQDPVIFSGTLRYNLDPFGEHSDSAIWMALELAHLKAFVNTLDKGLDYSISEEGGNLSVGQKQLICLTRALLKKPKILVMDEATASVDVETDALIGKTIKQEFKDCTVLTIAHRINTIMESDRIIVMESGEIKEFDKPDVLMLDEKSLFHSLCKDAGIL